MPSSTKHTVELTSKELDHICTVLAVDAETIETMMDMHPANKTDESLTADYKADINLIQKLANSKAKGE